MKKFFFFTLIVSLFAACNGNKKSETEAKAAVKPVYENQYLVKVGDVAPDFSLKLTDGEQFTLSSQRGKVVMLQFTASWCGVCRREMPHIEKDIWLRHKDNPSFVLVGVDREESKEVVDAYTKMVGTTYPMALDSVADVFSLYAERGAGITRNVLIGKDGRIVKLTRLFNETEFEGLVAAIDSLLAE